MIDQKAVEDSAQASPFKSANDQLQSEIANRHRVEDALQKRVLALTEPLDPAAKIRFSDLFGIESIQRLQDQFSDTMGVASLITEPDGTPITKPSNFTRFCSEIIRNTELGRCNCFKSDAALGVHCPSGPIMQPCLGGGLWDAGASITVGGKHIATWLIGQVRNEAQNEEQMLRYADKIGVAREPFRQALTEVPIMSTEHFQRTAQLLFSFAQELSNRAYQNIQQARFINERRLAEAAMRDAEAFSISVRDSLVEHLAVLDADGVIIAVNRAWRRFAEKNCASGPVQNSVGMNYLSMCETTPDRPQDEVAAAAHDGILSVLSGATKEFRMDYPCHSSEGQHWFQMNVTSLRGSKNGAVVAHLNITDRKQAEDALRESEALLRVSQNIANLGSYALDFSTGGGRTSEVFDRVLGIGQAHNRSGEGWLALVHPDDRAAVADYFWNDVVGQGQPFNKEYRIIRQDDQAVRWVSGLGILEFDAEGHPVKMCGTIQDITEHKQMEDELLRNERIESIGRLATGVAHDLNNVLTPILLSAEMLTLTEDPSTRECLASSIAECAKRGADVVNQVLTFARGSTGERTKVQLNPIVHEVEKIIRETFPKNITITSSIQTGLWLIKGDATKIHQVLLNFCINARDAMSEGGSLLISGENTQVEANLAAMVPDAKVGDYATLSISDSGMGIPRKIIAKIFNPFFTTKDVGKGTGLGLSTVTGIIRSHGGFVTVESEVGQGSTFKVFLPRDTDAVAKPRQVAPLVTPQGGGETILVVDDEVRIANAISMVLEKNGYKALVAAEGAEALVVYKAHASEIKIVLTDMIMPGMGGIQLAQALKKINPQATIIASAGQASEKLQSQLRAIGVHVILRKPYDTKKLLATLHDALHSECLPGDKVQVVRRTGPRPSG